MRIDRTQEWWLMQVDREGDQTVSAGLASRDPGQNEQPQSVAPAVQPAAEETRIAFGRFVTLMRRQRALSIEKLAETAELDVGELVSIEDDLHYMPEPRTVFRLAQTFDISQQRLMQLAGLASAGNANFRREAIRFAARSESVQKLTDQERLALEAFISFLSERDE